MSSPQSTVRSPQSAVDSPQPEGHSASALTVAGIGQVRRPRLGFLGVGWIGRHRMEAVAKSGVAEVAAIADASPEAAAQAAQNLPGIELVNSLDNLMEVGVDGIVIATPSALHAVQAVRALERGVAVFCQKPLGRTAAETRQVIAAARQADRLLGVDLSYRFLTAVRHLRDLCRWGELGDIYAAELVFHNAYGPDKSWFYDARLSGGGCVIDLGIHLVDLALWLLNFPRVSNVTSRLLAHGKPVAGATVVEDFAEARLDVENGPVIRLACSWKLPAGCDAVISGQFYGTRGGAGFHNLNGSFYHFAAERYCGTRCEVLTDAPEEWGGRAVVDWAQRLALSSKFNPEIERLNEVAGVLDEIYVDARRGSDAQGGKQELVCL